MSETTAATLDGPERRRRGAPLAEDRDPDSLCTAMRSDGVTPCTRFKVTGSTVCQVHGAHKAPRARHAIMTVAEKNGIVLPDVKPKDFPKIAAEVIAWNLQQFAELGAELEKLRLMHSPIDHPASTATSSACWIRWAERSPLSQRLRRHCRRHLRSRRRLPPGSRSRKR